jgi:tRNA(Ile)-lysidine synthase
VACSGGPDSQTLLHALSALRQVHGCELVAATVDHGLRAEAAAEHALAAQLAASLRISHVTLTVQVARGASRQARAREARYAALLAHAAATGAERVAVGHTRDDQAETVLARLLRGAGLEGISAIAPLRADGVVRPLLDCGRADVLAYLAAHEIASARDPSNIDPRYLRTRVRTRLLPALCEENPALPERLAFLADDARQAARLLDQHAAALLARAEGRAAVLREEPEILRRWALRAFVEPRAGSKLTRNHLAALDRMLVEGGSVRVPGDAVVAVDQAGVLSVSPVTKRGRGSRRPNDRAE